MVPWAGSREAVQRGVLGPALYDSAIANKPNANQLDRANDAGLLSKHPNKQDGTGLMDLVTDE
ncbi:hypothetical protein CVT25_007164 [Psilocybe cyanescens]|uniref:Uncharacterized protein n=1 Tax=Psilocybe cyanescens TaxID=93625 RepID=A0A409WVJ6_PSICY|nr:hypothetical protein CVT25_007164 [Psilocybe cyanescens]